MPSDFETDFADAAATVMSTFGRDAVVRSNKPGVANVTGIKARVKDERTQPKAGKDGATRDVWTGTLIILQADVAHLAKDWRVTLDGKWQWTIVKDPFLKNGEWICEDSERSGVDKINDRREGTA